MKINKGKNEFERELLRRGSLVGTDAKNPEEKLIDFVNKAIIEATIKNLDMVLESVCPYPVMDGEYGEWQNGTGVKMPLHLQALEKGYFLACDQHDKAIEIIKLKCQKQSKE